MSVVDFFAIATLMDRERCFHDAELMFLSDVENNIFELNERNGLVERHTFLLPSRTLQWLPDVTIPVTLSSD